MLATMPVPQLTVHSAEVKAYPFLILALVVICQTCAGTMYWFPAIIPGIAKCLNFSSAQSTAIVLAANSGSLLTIPLGLFHDRYGSRLTASISAFGLCLCYALLSVIVAMSSILSLNIAFASVFSAALGITMFSFALHSSGLTAAVSVFPQRYRGRIVGLCSTTFGGAAGVLTAIQAGFLPELSETVDNLVLVSVISLLAAIVSFLVFPQMADYDSESLMSQDEAVPLHPATSSSTRWDKHIMAYLTVAYCLLFSYLLFLQFAAISDIMHLAPAIKMVAALLVVASLLSILALPMRSNLTIYANVATSQHHDSADAQAAVEEEPGLWEVITDVRGIYIITGFILVVGAGGIGILVQLPYIVESLQHGSPGLWANYTGATIVRAMVTLFSACSVTGRLVGGVILDRGDSKADRLMWTFTIMRNDVLLMAVAQMLLCVPIEIAFYVAVALIGCACGMWLVASPTLITMCFGTRTLPRNYAAIGAFVVIASLLLDSAMPAAFRALWGFWVPVTVDGVDKLVCGGIWCRLPIQSLLSFLTLLMYVGGVLLTKTIRCIAEKRIF